MVLRLFFLNKKIPVYKWCYKYNAAFCAILIIITSESIKYSMNKNGATFVFLNKKYPSL